MTTDGSDETTRTADVHRLSPSALDRLESTIVDCRACPRLVAWREQVAQDKRAAYRDDDYWGAPVPGFGDPGARLVIVGLAPAAHGANRTGRVFTGDRSGDFLYAALHRAGLANRPTSEHRGDGLELTGCWVTAAVRCAPPGNRPTPAERDACAPYLRRELGLLPAQVVLALGAFAWDVLTRILAAPRPRPAFSHGATVGVALPDDAGGGTSGRSMTLVGSYHVSQQNTFTGRLTPAMLDEVLTTAVGAVEDMDAVEARR